MTHKEVVFMDIETVPCDPLYSNLDSRLAELFKSKCMKMKLITEDIQPDMQKIWEDNAALHAEFGMIACVVLGFYTGSPDEFRITCVSNHGGNKESEEVMLKTVCEHLTASSLNARKLVAHNGKNFDYPFLVKRMLINRIPIPAKLNTLNKKPWEVDLMDTADMWKSGAFAGQTASLDLIAYNLGLPSPKSEMDGSMVWRYFYSGVPTDKSKINKYCENDVRTLANVYCRIIGANSVEPLTLVDVK